MTTAIASRATPAIATSPVIHRGREFTLRPGSMVLLKLDEPFFAADGANHKRFTNVHLPMATLRAMVPDVDDLVGRELEPGGALSLAMDYSDLLLQHPAAVDEAGMAIASHLLDLAALGLGARGDLAVAARRGGLRAVRLKAVLTILEAALSRAGFFRAEARRRGRPVGALCQRAAVRGRRQLHDPAERIAAAQGGRTAGASRGRISDIAFECGFNDLSYFNRCFRRRFGLTPTARAGGRGTTVTRQLAPACARYHLMTMSNDDIYSATHRSSGASQNTSRADFGGAEARGPVIDQEGREIPAEPLGPRIRRRSASISAIAPTRSAISPASSGWSGSRRSRSCSTSPSSCPAPTSATASTASSA